MPDPAQITSTIDRYLAAVSAGDLEAILAMYTEEAEVEDPVGSGVLHGERAIRGLYERAFRTPLHAARTGPVRVAGGRAAFPFRLTVPATGTAIDIIDVFTFAEDGRIADMRAYWGPENFRRLQSA